MVAPATGTVSFAGTVPTSGESVTIETADGYSVTLTHLGSIGVAKGGAVSEGGAVGTIGPSGTPEVDGPYVHLGVRHTTDPNGYVDPLGLLPPLPIGSTGSTDATASQPSSSGSGSSTAPGSASSTSPPAPPATQPASSEPASQPASSSPTSTTTHVRTRGTGQTRARTSLPRAESRPTSHAEGRPVTRPRRQVVQRDARPAVAARRPVVETAAPAERTRFGAGHEPGSSVRAESAPARRPAPGTLPPLFLNGAAAVVAVGAALMASRSRRRRRVVGSAAAAQVFDLPSRERERRPISRAA